MSIKGDLTVLKTNIQNAKNKLYTNLTEKGITTITTASTLDAMADSVIGITVGGSIVSGNNPFFTIGYSSTPQYIQDGIDYAKQIKDNWDASITLRNKAFSGDTQLVYFPQVDTSNVITMDTMFSGCNNLTYIPSINTSNVTNMFGMFQSCTALKSLDLSSFATSNVTDMGAMFNQCSGLKYVNLSSFNTSNVTNMISMFKSCYNLTSLDLSSFDTSNVINFDSFLGSCNSITQIKGVIDVKSVTSNYNLNICNFNNLEKLRTITFSNIGYVSSLTTYSYLSHLITWGVNDNTVTDARQSLIDSLITYSFDRVVARYSTCTITLSSNTKAVLTDEEIAQITAKGYTIA